MAGITGIFTINDCTNASAVVRNMSNALQYRGNESLQQYNDSTYPDRTAIISIRGKKIGLQHAELGQSRLVIVDSLFPLITDFKKELLKDSQLFNAISIKIDSAGLAVARSIDGSRGFYYARIDEGIIFASERKGIWRIVTEGIDILNPGQMLSISWTGESKITQFACLTSTQVQRSTDRKTAVEILKKTLKDSFKYIPKDEKCAVLFSGGVDSALVALMTMKECRDTLLVTALCKDSHDETAAIENAKVLGANHAIVLIDDKTIWDALPEVIYSIETSNRMQVEIALPFFLAAREARRRDCDLVISGQGPDELFAGYARYETLMQEQGSKALEKALANDVAVTHESNLQRDVRAIAFHGLEVFFPYLYPPFVEAALALPATLKIDFSEQPARKSIFRDLAVDLGLPEKMSKAPKRATQYSSGTSKLLTSVIKQRLESVERRAEHTATEIVQDVLDAIAAHLGIPGINARNTPLFDLKPTERLKKKIYHSAASN
jgi:asparagine synthase (glutamine-hydrolysing)